MAGSLATPDAFEDELGGAAWYTRLRGLDGWRFRHDWLLRRTLTTADVVIGVAPYVRQVLERTGVRLRSFEVQSEVGLDEVPPARIRARRDDHSDVRLLFVGRLVRTKGARDAIRALAHLGDLSVTLDVVGEGEDRTACEREARALGLGDRVRFHGRLPRYEVDERYADADVFIFPSWREPSANVVVESMSHGLPLIVAANGGPGHAVDDRCGIRVEVTEPARYARDLADAVRRLVDDARLRDEMGRAAHRKASVSLWPSKIEWLDQVYQRVLARSMASPKAGAVRRTGAPGALGLRHLSRHFVDMAVGQ
jgi:glycosyltransferase involved in cell wall biosynthesis